LFVICQKKSNGVYNISLEPNLEMAVIFTIESTIYISTARNYFRNFLEDSDVNQKIKNGFGDRSIRNCPRFAIALGPGDSKEK